MSAILLTNSGFEGKTVTSNTLASSFEWLKDPDLIKKIHELTQERIFVFVAKDHSGAVKWYKNESSKNAKDYLSQIIIWESFSSPGKLAIWHASLNVGAVISYNRCMKLSEVRTVQEFIDYAKKDVAASVTQKLEELAIIRLEALKARKETAWKAADHSAADLGRDNNENKSASSS